MKKYLSGFLIAAGAASFACSEASMDTTRNANAKPPSANSSPAANVPFPDVERIPLNRAKAMYDEQTAVFVDTHSKGAFESEHITGAINVPANDFAAHLDKLPKDKTIIAYCS